MEKQKIMSLGLIVLLLVGIVFISGCVNDSKVESIPSGGEEKAPEEIVEDETADWKIYKNEEYQYEIKYPRDFEVVDMGELMGVKGLPHTVLISKEEVPVMYEIMTDLSMGWNSESWKKDIASSCGKTNSVEIGEKSGLKAVCEGKKSAIFIIEHQGKIYKISYEIEPLKSVTENELELYLKYFNQMVSSFRFLE